MNQKIRNNLLFFIIAYVAFSITFPFINSIRVSTHTQGTYTVLSYYFIIPLILSIIGICMTNSYCTTIFINLRSSALQTILIMSLIGATLTFLLDFSMRRISFFKKINPIYSKIVSFIIVCGLMLFLYILFKQNNYTMYFLF